MLIGSNLLLDMLCNIILSMVTDICQGILGSAMDATNLSQRGYQPIHGMIIVM